MGKSVRSKLANLIAILGTIPDTTAPKPLYNPRGVSLAAICFPVAKNPSGLSYHQRRTLLLSGCRDV